MTLLAQVELLLAAERADGPLVGHLLLNLLILPALGLRRSAPLGAVLIAAASLLLQPLAGEAPVATGFLVILVLLVSLGWHAGLRRGLLGLGAVVSGAAFFELSTGPAPAADLVVNLVLLVAAWLAGHGLRRSVDRAVRAEVTAERTAREAIAAERARIAGDLHDSLAHTLTLITLQAGGTRERVTDAQAVHTLDSIEELGRQALTEMQDVLAVLDRADGRPGVEQIPVLVERVRRNGLPVRLSLTAGPCRDEVSTAIYRVVQEGLTNAVRHSQAESVDVVVRGDTDGVIAVVTSSGRPRPSPSLGSGRGLGGLRRRLEELGGNLCAGATEQGWRLEARIRRP